MTNDKDVKLSNIQLGLLLFGFLYGSTAILNPAGGAGRDAWMAVILGSAAGIMLLLAYSKISMLNPGQTLVEILKSCFGKVIGSVVAVLYIWYFTHLTALIILNFGEFMSTVSYPETPRVVIMGIFAALVVYTIKSGLENTARVSEIVVPVIPVIVLTLCSALITIHDFGVFKPVFEKGSGPVFKSGFALSAFPFGEAVAFISVFPYLNKRKHLMKTVFIAGTAVGTIFLIGVTRDTLLLGAILIENINYVTEITAKLIPGISIEPFIEINLLIGGGIKAAICLYAASRGTAQLLKSEDYKPLASAFAIFAVVLTMWLYTNALEMSGWAKNIWPYYSIPFQYIVPLLLLIISLIKKHKAGKRKQKAAGNAAAGKC